MDDVVVGASKGVKQKSKIHIKNKMFMPVGVVRFLCLCAFEFFCLCCLLFVLLCIVPVVVVVNAVVWTKKTKQSKQKHETTKPT